METIKNLDFLPFLADKLSRSADRLNETKTGLGAGLNLSDPSFLQQQSDVAARYTMDRERQVHNACIPAPADSLNDIELFDDNEMEMPERQGTVPADSECMGDNIEFF